MNEEVFETRNELEEKLVAAQEGNMASDEFMKYLMDTQLFMPVKDSIGIEGFTNSDKAIPLTLKSEDNVEVVILFSSPDRAREFLHDYPGYDGGLLAEFSWIVERTGSGVGVSINPNWPVGMDMEPDMVQQLKSN